MLAAVITVTLTDVALQLIIGGVVAALVGRAMGGGLFGAIGDVVIGIFGALAANYVVTHFGLLSPAQYGLLTELFLALVGVLVLVVLLHVLAPRRSSS